MKYTIPYRKFNPKNTDNICLQPSKCILTRLWYPELPGRRSSKIVYLRSFWSNWVLWISPEKQTMKSLMLSQRTEVLQSTGTKLKSIYGCKDLFLKRGRNLSLCLNSTKKLGSLSRKYWNWLLILGETLFWQTRIISVTWKIILDRQRWNKLRESTNLSWLGEWWLENGRDVLGLWIGKKFMKQ